MNRLSVNRLPLLFLLGVMLLFGCGKNGSEPSSSGGNSQPSGADNGHGGYNSYYTDGEITFVDNAASNTPLDEGLTKLAFVDTNGKETTVSDYAGEKMLVLVLTRGNTDPICPYCSTQTVGYISQYEEFVKRGAEVLLVYPIEKAVDSARVDAFLENVRQKVNDPNRPVPFPVLLDVELRAVNHLGIRENLSKPATYIIDREGKVRYAYVGKERQLSDRPSVQAVLGELDKLTATPLPAS
ncbi:MAG: redoxin domain-containing protein [Planctomycetaceae bacterium]